MRPEPSNDERIEALLRRTNPADLPDGGFTQRVLQALPHTRRRTGVPRWVLFSMGAGAGLLAALCLAPGVAEQPAAAVFSSVTSNPIAVVAVGAAIAAAIVLTVGERIGIEI